MPLVFEITNAGSSEITLSVQGREPTADFAITDSAGRPVWSLLKGQVVLGSLRLLPLGVGKHLTFRQIWNQQTDGRKLVAPGDYLVRARLLTDAPGGLASAPSRIRILNPDG